MIRTGKNTQYFIEITDTEEKADITGETEDIEENKRKVLLYYCKRYICFLYSIASGVSCMCLSYFWLSFAQSNYIPLIAQKANSISSVSYALVDAPPLVRFPLFVLSVASVCLWAYPTTAVNFVDVSSIFWVIIAVTINIFPNAKHTNIVLGVFNLLFVVFLVTTIVLKYDTIVLTYYADNLVVLTALIYGLSGLKMSSFHATNPLFLQGMLCISFGFICKLMTIFQGQYWGTAVFHTMTALGTHILLRLKTN
jgi:hypothetical protein